MLARSTTAGFNVPGMQWYEYLFTQFRVWFLYLRLAVFPWAQNADYDIPLSRTFFEHGSAIALLAAIAIAVLAGVSGTNSHWRSSACSCSPYCWFQHRR